MAQSDRHYTGDMTVFTLNGNSVLATFKNCKITVLSEMQESKAALDAWRYRVPRESQWDMEVPKVVENELAAANLLTAWNTQVAFTMTTAPTGKKGITLSGNVFVRQVDLSFPDTDGQEHNYGLEGRGALTITIPAS